MRRVSFTRGGGAARFRGVARVIACGPNVALYAEEGLLTIGGRTVRATRSTWLRDEPGAVLALYFADGEEAFDPGTARPFVRLEAGAGGALAGTHRCGPDRYEGSYRVPGAGAIAMTWRVEGPRKAGTIRTRLLRVAWDGAAVPGEPGAGRGARGVEK